MMAFVKLKETMSCCQQLLDNKLGSLCEMDKVLETHLPTKTKHKQGESLHRSITSYDSESGNAAY